MVPAAHSSLAGHPAPPGETGGLQVYPPGHRQPSPALLKLNFVSYCDDQGFPYLFVLIEVFGYNSPPRWCFLLMYICVHHVLKQPVRFIRVTEFKLILDYVSCCRLWFTMFCVSCRAEHAEIHHEEERRPSRLQRHQEEPAVRRGERRVRNVFNRPQKFAA